MMIMSLVIKGKNQKSLRFFLRKCVLTIINKLVGQIHEIKTNMRK